MFSDPTAIDHPAVIIFWLTPLGTGLALIVAPAACLVGLVLHALGRGRVRLVTAGLAACTVLLPGSWWIWALNSPPPGI
ncbi:MAG: hypothetical protein ACPGQL_03040 [Thermoplasmatota archaeon]